VRERGPGEALRTAAVPPSSPRAVDVELADRYPGTWVDPYYLGAVRNAGKHAGTGATILVHVDHTDGTLRFTDDGPGFDAGAARQAFVDVRDRLDAAGGTLQIASAPAARRSPARSPDRP